MKKKKASRNYDLGYGMTTSDVEKPFKATSKGLDFGKPKKVKKSFNSEGLRL